MCVISEQQKKSNVRNQSHFIHVLSLPALYRALETPGCLFLSRLISQAACEPGILTAWTELLNPSASSPQLRALPAGLLDGKTYGEIRWQSNDIVCGYVRSPDGQVVASPDDATPLGPGDRLIVLIRGGSGGSGSSGGDRIASAQPSATASSQLTPALERAAVSAAARKRMSRASSLEAASSGVKEPCRILVLGWPSRELPTLLEGLNTFAAADAGGNSITVLSADPPPPGFDNLVQKLQRQRSGWLPWRRTAGFSIQYVHSTAPLSQQALADGGVRSCDVVVVGSAPAPTTARAASTNPTAGEEAALEQVFAAKHDPASESPMMHDARLMMALLSLQKALLQSGRQSAPHVVAPISTLASAELARSFFGTLQQQQQQQQQQQPALKSNALLGPTSLGFLKPNGVIASLLVQMSMDECYSNVMKELLWSAEGHELYLKAPSQYGIRLGECINV
jgi:hypothetical protein